MVIKKICTKQNNLMDSRGVVAKVCLGKKIAEGFVHGLSMVCDNVKCHKPYIFCKTVKFNLFCKSKNEFLTGVIDEHDLLYIILT